MKVCVKAGCADRRQEGAVTYIVAYEEKITESESGSIGILLLEGHDRGWVRVSVLSTVFALLCCWARRRRRSLKQVRRWFGGDKWERRRREGEGNRGAFWGQTPKTQTAG